MKKYIITATVLVVLSAGSLFANKASKYVDKAMNNYLHCLDENRSQLVESAIFNVMALKQDHPESDYKAVVIKLNKLSKKSDNPEIRFKAFLASNYLKNTEWFGEYQFKGQKDSSMIFDDIAQKLDIRNKIKSFNGSKVDSRFLKAQEIYPVRY